MLLQLSQVKTTLDEGAQAALDKAALILRLKENRIIDRRLARVSIDARKKRDIRFVSNVIIEVEDSLGEKLLRKSIDNLTLFREPPLPTFQKGEEPLRHRPIVIGFGPAGMFAALILSQNGYRPIVLERGGTVEQRVAAVERFWQGGALDDDTNVQFGEGGAGTFSDGKLTTRINDPLCGYILGEMVRHGAPSDILLKAKPHVGTDILRTVVKNIREEIISLGGEVRFLSKAESFSVSNGKLCAVNCSGSALPAEAVIAAVGHSARDTFGSLAECGAAIVPKPFSVGARIEHLQSDIDSALYGESAGHKNLPAGEYQLSNRVGERAAYTFCMCPGGMVVAAASEKGQTVTNGMSYRARNLKNANSALVVSVNSADFGESWRDAVAFQQRLEQAAFEAGSMGKNAPCMRVGDLLKSCDEKGFSAVEPSYPRGVVEYDLSRLFPKQVSGFMIESLPILGRKLHGFDSANAMLTGVETRTSSPIRVLRKADYTAENIDGLYPCGEGAGYAGGITSAAVDGIRCAMALMSRYKPC